MERDKRKSPHGGHMRLSRSIVRHTLFKPRIRGFLFLRQCLIYTLANGNEPVSLKHKLNIASLEGDWGVSPNWDEAVLTTGRKVRQGAQRVRSGGTRQAYPKVVKTLYRTCHSRTVFNWRNGARTRDARSGPLYLSFFWRRNRMSVSRNARRNVGPFEVVEQHDLAAPYLTRTLRSEDQFLSRRRRKCPARGWVGSPNWPPGAHRAPGGFSIYGFWRIPGLSQG